MKKLVVGLVVCVFGSVLPVGSAGAEEQEQTSLEVVDELLEERPELERAAIEPDVALKSNSEVVVDGIGEGDGLSLTRVSKVNERQRRQSGMKVSFGDTVIEGTSDGFRVMEIIPDKGAQRRFRYKANFDGRRAIFVVNPDGSVTIGDGTTREYEPVATIEAPWAYDAAGAEVAAEFRVNRRGTVLSLVVRPTAGVEYPIVADPSVHYSWWGKTYKFTASEWDDLDAALEFNSGTLAIVAVVCTYSTAGYCSVPWAALSAMVLLGKSAIRLCHNSRGVDIHVAHGNTAVWCSGY